MRKDPSPRRSPLTHPLWWAALAVLLLNDHLIKGADLLPGWMTGKLSDFAGLLVAPVLVAELVRARSTRGRTFAFAAVALPFALINVSPAFASSIESLATSVGLHWRIWTDPTDLLALAALPVAWWLSEGRGERTARDRSLTSAAVVLGAIACMATSQVPPPPPPFFTTNAFLLNRTGESLRVRVRWVDANIDCDDIAADPARALSRGVFDEGFAFDLDSNDTLPLERSAALSAIGDPGTGTGLLRCDAVLVQADGLTDSVVFWKDLPTTSVDANIPSGESSLPGQVAIDAGTGSSPLTASGAGGVVVADLLERIEPEACGASVDASFEWSAPDLPVLGLYRLAGSTTLPDGCQSLDLVDDLDGTETRAYLCVPGWAFPFVEGDLLHLTVEQPRPNARSFRIVRQLDGGVSGAELVLWTIDGALNEGDVRGMIVPLACAGERQSCGAYTTLVSLSLEGDPDPLLPGEQRVLPADALGRPRTISLGRAEQTLVARETCPDGRNELRVNANALVLYEEVM